jgi:hypothetical protein
MTSFIEIPILISSSTSAGAYNVSSGHNKFDVTFQDEVKIPQHARNITVEVANASIWNTAFNISTALNNNYFYLDVSGDQVYRVLIPDGLYDLSTLANAINISLVNSNLPSNIITFTADNATQKVIINFTVAGLRLDFTQNDTCRDILGFNDAYAPAVYTTDNISIYGNSTAGFNLVDYFLIHSSIVSGGLSINGTKSSVVSRILIDASPGSQIVYFPHIAIKVPAQNLANSTIHFAHSWLTDQNNKDIDLNGEDWSYTIVIRFQL